MVVAAADPLGLPDGTSITLLFRSGQMLRLRGPLEASLDRAEPAAATTARCRRSPRRSGCRGRCEGDRRHPRDRPLTRCGRGPAGRCRSAPATYCIRPPIRSGLSAPRPRARPTALRRRGGSRGIAWPAGAGRVEWPDDVPIEDGDRFELVADGTAQATLTFRVLAPRFAGGRVAAGILSGCHEQYDAALRRLARAAVPPELWLTSDRGRAPIYRAGEPIGLTVMADTDGYLYCVLSAATTAAVPVFPAGAMDGARLRARCRFDPRRPAECLSGPGQGHRAHRVPARRP